MKTETFEAMILDGAEILEELEFTDVELRALASQFMLIGFNYDKHLLIDFLENFKGVQTKRRKL